jgi:hypothetical protein
MDMNLALVVGGAAAKDIAVANFRLESRGGPEFQGFRGLNIVVAVKENRGFAGSFEGFGVNEGVKSGGNDLNGLEPRGMQTVGDPFRSAVDIRFMFAFGADRGDAEKLVKFPEMLFAATFYKFSKVHMRPSGARIIVRFQSNDCTKMKKKSAAAVWSRMRPA